MKYVTVLIYVIIIALSIISDIRQESTSMDMIVSFLLLLFILSLHYYWAYTIVNYQKKFYNQTRYLKWYIILAVFGFSTLSANVILQTTNLYLPNTSSSNIIDGIGVLSVFSFISVLFVASKALVRMEKTALNKEGSVFGAWILLIYLPLGVFHIDKQLKKIKNHHAVTKA